MPARVARRSILRTTTLAAAAATSTAALAVAAPTAMAASAPKGTLSSSEYRQLTAEQAAYRKLTQRKRVTWTQIAAVCHTVGRSTALLSSVRTNCDTGVGVDQSLAGFYADLDRCAALTTNTTTGTTTTATGTTTTGTSTTITGTTTTGGSGVLLTPAELKLFACLQPEYAVIGRAVKSLYSAQAGLRSQVLARDFAGRCRLTLAPSTAQLKALSHFAATSRQLAADVALITKVANGQAPASALNGTQIKDDSAAFAAAGKAFEHLHRPQKLSVCPHR
jgi:hypothetical protein